VYFFTIQASAIHKHDTGGLVSTAAGDHAGILIAACFAFLQTSLFWYLREIEDMVCDRGSYTDFLEWVVDDNIKGLPDCTSFDRACVGRGDGECGSTCAFRLLRFVVREHLPSCMMPMDGANTSLPACQKQEGFQYSVRVSTACKLLGSVGASFRHLSVSR
jgi:hypothetical protein